MAESVALAKSLGAQGGAAVRELVAEPFILYTSFADGGDDGGYKRIFCGFMTLAAGCDSAASTCRTLRCGPQPQPPGPTPTVPSFGGERAAQRQADSELDLATGKATPTEYLDINAAARDELMRIPGIREHLAGLIMRIPALRLPRALRRDVLQGSGRTGRSQRPALPVTNGFSATMHAPRFPENPSATGISPD